MKEIFEKFINDPKTQKLSEESQKFNAFFALKIWKTEIYHSNLLAWLFNPHENHGLGTKFLRHFITKFSLSDIDCDTIKKVYREYLDTDILLEGDGWCIVIENKIYSYQHGKQLQKYEEKIKQKFADKKTFYFLYLKPWNNEHLPNKWRFISYEAISQILKTIAKKDISAEIYDFITQYIKVIDMITDNVEERTQYLELYSKYQHLFDKIYDYKENQQAILKSLLEGIIKTSNKNLILMESGEKYIRFYSSTIKQKDFKYGENWKPNNYIIFYEFQNKKNELSLDVVIGKTTDKYQDKKENLIKFLCKQLKIDDSNLYQQNWCHIYSKTILYKNEYWQKVLSPKELTKNIQNNITHIVSKFDALLEKYYK